MIITMWLQVRAGDLPAGVIGDLWYKKVKTGCVPVPGVDQVTLWAYEEDPSDGPQWSIQQRSMDSEGNWIIQLGNMDVDPSGVSILAANDRSMPWQTISDGDPEEGLRKGGWRKHGEV